MADWATISSLATAGGTLVLAAATFSAVRSSNRSARIAEQALQEQRWPVLMHARLDDPQQKVMFADGHWLHVEGSQAAFEVGDDAIYAGIAVRNVGSGIAVLQGWHPWSHLITGDGQPAPDAEDFRRQIRDIYVAPGDIGLWQGAVRPEDGEVFTRLAAAAAERQPITIDLLYSDLLGGLRTISRFILTPAGDEQWLGSVGRHWNLDVSGPR